MILQFFFSFYIFFCKFWLFTDITSPDIHKYVHTQYTIALRRAKHAERVLANLNAIGPSEHIDNYMYSDSLYLNWVLNSLYTAC